MKEKNIPLVACPECRSDVDLKIIKQEEKEILEGVFTCKTCNAWYPISNGIPNMLPEHLADKKAREDFKKKHKLKVKAKKNSSSMSDAEKMKQINFYNEDCDEYDENLEKTPFWAANDWNCIKSWLPRTKPGQLMLDIGCGTGRASFPFAKHRGVNVMAFDIFEGMVTLAKEKAEKLGIGDKIEYMVGDAENPPFKEKVFDRVIVFGVLHHVPSPRKVLSSIQRMLKKDGLYFGHENNKSALRGLFDLSMHIYKLWNEEAGNHPLISEKEVKHWGKHAGLKIYTRTSVFLPPHLFNAVGHKSARTLLRSSDKFFTSLPVAKHHGGALIILGKPLK